MSAGACPRVRSKPAVIGKVRAPKAAVTGGEPPLTATRTARRTVSLSVEWVSPAGMLSCSDAPGSRQDNTGIAVEAYGLHCLGASNAPIQRQVLCPRRSAT